MTEMPREWYWEAAGYEAEHEGREDLSDAVQWMTYYLLVYEAYEDLK
jgi:hypothetical protein